MWSETGVTGFGNTLEFKFFGFDFAECRWLTCFLSSRQPWSAYAVHLTTLSPPALLGDLLLVWLCHKATGSWGESLHDQSMTLLYMWIFTSKWIKLLGHYLRYPVDVLLLPVSILFGYFHGAIKMYAVMTLNVVCSTFFFLIYIPLSTFFFELSTFSVFSYLRCRCVSKRSPSFPPYPSL